MEFFRTTASIFFETAPFLILGLFLVGWLSVIIPRERIIRYMGGGNIKSAFFASLFGLPLPLCSCSVVPVTLGLKRKGASREANLSFLISTPETSIDTVILSWGILGPFMAWFRPAVSLITSLFAGLLSIAERTDRPPEAVDESAGETGTPEEERVLLEGIGFRKVGKALIFAVRRMIYRVKAGMKRNPPEIPPCEGPSFLKISGVASKYGFVSILDSLSDWFVLGIVIAGLLSSFVPQGWFSSLPGGNFAAMVFMALIGIPMYVCALESTPIAAVLIAKGLSPGAALVFLLVGPATNFTSLIMLMKSFGKRFVSVYLASIVIVSLGAGYLLDVLVEAFEIPVAYQFMSGGVSGFWTVFSWVSSLCLLVLLLLSLRRKDWSITVGKLRRGMRNISGFFGLLKAGAEGVKTFSPARLILRVAGIALVIMMITGLYTVPPGAEGFELTFGKLSRTGVPPGLHYHLPAPVQRHLIYPVGEVRVVEIGYRLDKEVLQRWKNKTITRNTVGWHSFFTTMKTDQEVSNYLLGDENQIEAKFSVHFRISDPVSFFFEHYDGNAVVRRVTEASLKTYFADSSIDIAMTTGRGIIEAEITEKIQKILDQYGLGVELLHLYVVDLHPPVEAVSAFRDVASAMEDRQTRIHEAYTARASALPLARGREEGIIKEAGAYAETTMKQSLGDSERFVRLETEYRVSQGASRLVLFLESMERALPGKKIYLAPQDLLEKSTVKVWPAGNLLWGE